MGWFDGWNKRSRPKAKSFVPHGEARQGVASAAKVQRRRMNTAATFPRFQSTAGDLVDPRLSDRFADVRMRLRNAYTPSQPVTDRRMFAGRTEVLTRLIRAIEHQRLHAVIYGGRGIGKTSLLHVLAQTARDARYLVVYIPCGAGSDFSETFRALAREISLLFHSDFGPTTAEAERSASWAEVLPAGPISAPLASEILSKVTGTRILLILDEFDRCESVPFRLAIAELIKNLSDRSVRVQIVIAGVAGNLTELIEHVPSIQRNIFALQLPRMTASEVRDLVRNGEESCGLEFDDAAVEFVASAAIGFPYFASLLSHHAGLNAIDHGRITVSATDVSEASAIALSELWGRMSRHLQFQIDTFLHEKKPIWIGPLCGLALSPSGGFTRDDAIAVFSKSEFSAYADQFEELVGSLVAAGLLRECDDNDSQRYYRFLDDSIPSYFWLLSVQTEFLAKLRAPPNGTLADQPLAAEV